MSRSLLQMSELIPGTESCSSEGDFERLAGRMSVMGGMVHLLKRSDPHATGITARVDGCHRCGGGA